MNHSEYPLDFLLSFEKQVNVRIASEVRQCLNQLLDKIDGVVAAKIDVVGKELEGK